jgi:ubiquinone/menaquinone biosynthesis C-methylase UbiE
MENYTEQERIARVYREWNGGAALPRYAWHRAEILQQNAARIRTFTALLGQTVGFDLAPLHILDVGCGSGQFLRQLIDWGANPAHLTGTEFQPERLAAARRGTRPGVRWHLGGLDALPDGSVDLATAQTVFSSILDDGARRALAADMWRVLRPGGWCMVFDFRFNNPRNRNVRKVTRTELHAWWPARARRYRSLLLAPPLARAMAGLPWLVPESLAALAPPLRTHFMFMAQKER